MDQKLRCLKSKPESQNFIQTKLERDALDMEDIFRKVTMKRHIKDKNIKKKLALERDM